MYIPNYLKAKYIVKETMLTLQFRMRIVYFGVAYFVKKAIEKIRYLQAIIFRTGTTAIERNIG